MNKPILCISWSGRTALLAVGMKCETRLYGVRNNNLLFLRRLSGHDDLITAMCFGENRLYTGGYDCNLNIYSVELRGVVEEDRSSKSSRRREMDIDSDGAHVFHMMTVPNCHESCVSTMLFEPNTKTLITGGHDNRIKVWNCDGSLMSTIDVCSGCVRSLVYVKSMSLLLICDGSRYPYAVDIATGFQVW